MEPGTPLSDNVAGQPLLKEAARAFDGREETVKKLRARSVQDTMTVSCKTRHVLGIHSNLEVCNNASCLDHTPPTVHPDATPFLHFIEQNV